MDPFGHTFNRLLAVFGLSIVFVATASIISPRTSSAGPAGTPSGAVGQILGRLKGIDCEVVIYATRAGPRYSVLDTNGIPLAENLTIEQLGRQFAGLDLMVDNMMRSKATLRMGSADETNELPVTDRN